VVQLLALASRADARTRQLAMAQQIAREKMEQIGALTWRSDGGSPVTDWNSDLTITPTTASGGTGLGASPPGTLTANIPGYCDFEGSDGRWLAAGDGAAAGAAWVRRWAIEELRGVSDTLFVQVVVLPAGGQNLSSVAGFKAADGLRLVAIRTRTSR
jgi:hypothetical protein